MLVSQGARAFAASNDIHTCDFTALVAPRCISEWEHWKKILVDSPSSTPQKDLDVAMPMQDTVGAISWDLNGNLAAGVSRFATGSACSCTHSVHSGGLLLKYPGRIGEVRKLSICSGLSVDAYKAAVFGAGCWSQSYSGIGVTCSASGLVDHSTLPILTLTDYRNRGADYLCCDSTDSFRTTARIVLPTNRIRCGKRV